MSRRLSCPGRCRLRKKVRNTACGQLCPSGPVEASIRTVISLTNSQISNLKVAELSGLHSRLSPLCVRSHPRLHLRSHPALYMLLCSLHSAYLPASSHQLSGSLLEFYSPPYTNFAPRRRRASPSCHPRCSPPGLPRSHGACSLNNLPQESPNFLARQRLNPFLFPPLPPQTRKSNFRPRGFWSEFWAPHKFRWNTH